MHNSTHPVSMYHCYIAIITNDFNCLGGLYRSCLVGDERHLLPDVMRPSGDLGHIDEDGKLFYDGRCDRQVKRLGHRVNLDYIQQVVHIYIDQKIFIATKLTSASMS